MWIDDCDYFDYDEFDQQIEEFKNSLRDSVKQEIQDKIKNLEDELAKYADIKANYEAKMSEMNNTIAEYNRMKDELQKDQEEKLRKLAYTDIFKGDGIDAWGICYSWDYITPKCDKCDDKRQIHFKSPSGVDHYEPCSCSKKRATYDIVPAEVSMIRSKISNRSISDVKDTLYFEYKVDRVWNEEEHILERVTTKDINDFDLTDSSKYHDYSWQATQHGVVFLNREDAQTLCNWLNKMSLEESQKNKK